MDNKRILYNVTIKVLSEVEDNWLTWMKTDHIPEVMETNCFISSRISKMIFPEDEEGATYTVQYLCKNMAHLNKYNEEYAQHFQKIHGEKFHEKFVAFRSVMEMDDEFFK